MAQSHSVRLGDGGMTWETLKVRKGGPGLLGRLQVGEGSPTEVRGSRRMREIRLEGNVGKSKPRSQGKEAPAERGEASGVGRLRAPGESRR